MTFLFIFFIIIIIHFFYGNEHSHKKTQKQHSPGTMTIMGSRDTKKVITKRKN